MSKTLDFIVILLFMANLEQSGGSILYTEPAKVMFSIKITFYLTEIENRT